MVATKTSLERPAIKREWLIGAGLAAVLVILIVFWYFRPNPQVAKVREMQKEIFAKSPENLTPEERKEKFTALRAEQEKLSTEERQELRKEIGQQFQAKAAAEALAYMKLTPAEKRKLIDEKLTREQAWQQKRTQMAAAAGGQGGAAKGIASGGGAIGQPGGGGAGSGPSGGGPGGPGNGIPPKGPPTPEDRDNRRRESLIHTSAEARTAMDQMRLDMAARRAQLGLPTPPQGKGRPR